MKDFLNSVLVFLICVKKLQLKFLTEMVEINLKFR